MSDLTRAVKFLMGSIAIYIIAGLMWMGSSNVSLQFPTPPRPPSTGGPLDWAAYAVALIAYPFTLLFKLLGYVVTVMTFSFLPSPWNMLIAVPVAAMFFYGLFVLILVVIEKVGSLIP